MLFKLTPTTGQPLYVQLMQQIRHATETGALEDGDQLPGIRTLAEELVVSPNTVAKAYSELEHEGLLDLREGAGAFVSRESAIARVPAQESYFIAARRRTGRSYPHPSRRLGRAPTRFIKFFKDEI